MDQRSGWTIESILDCIGIAIGEIDNHLDYVLPCRYCDTVILRLSQCQSAWTECTTCETHRIGCICDWCLEVVVDGDVNLGVRREAHHGDLVIGIVEIIYEHDDRGRECS